MNSYYFYVPKHKDVTSAYYESEDEPYGYEIIGSNLCEDIYSFFHDGGSHRKASIPTEYRSIKWKKGLTYPGWQRYNARHEGVTVSVNIRLEKEYFNEDYELSMSWSVKGVLSSILSAISPSGAIGIMSYWQEALEKYLQDNGFQLVPKRFGEGQ